jgi:hypothetical protein
MIVIRERVAFICLFPPYSGNYILGFRILLQSDGQNFGENRDFTFVAVARHLKTNQQHQYFEKFLFCELILKMTSIYQSSVKFVPEISLVRDDDPRLSLDGLHHEGAHVGVGEGLVEGGNIVVGNALEPRN